MKEVVTFSDRHSHFAICFLDIVDSSKIVAELSGRLVDVLYGTFLNNCSQVIRENSGHVIKNIGDGLLFYFPETDFGTSEDFKPVLDCAFALLLKRNFINEELAKEGLPAISYRISASYGPVSVTESDDFKVEDIFGVTVNTGAKINKHAPINGLLIGGSLYNKVQNTEGYRFDEKEEFQINNELKTTLYVVYKK